jgi:hypothetical protein
MRFINAHVPTPAADMTWAEESIFTVADAVLVIDRIGPPFDGP